MSAFDTLTVIPCYLTAGEAVSWTETPSDYPPASYAIVYKFAGQTPQDGYQVFSITGQESGSTYTFTFPTALKPGVYNYERQVTRASDSTMRVDGTGTVTVRANLATAPTTTQAALMLAALDAAILALSSSQEQSVSFNGQSVTKADLKSLMAQRVALQAEVYREQQRVLALSGAAQSGAIGMRFGRRYSSPFWPR